MNDTMQINGLTRLARALCASAPARASALPGEDFLSAAARIAAEQSAGPAENAGAVSGTADMSMEAYRQLIWDKIAQLPMSASSRLESISVHISDEGLAAMKNDPEYEAWVLDTLAANFRFENPWTAMCGGGYAVHHFGAAKEEYHGESWYAGYGGGKGGTLFDEKSKRDFWQQRAERQEEFQKLRQEAELRRKRLLKQRLGDGSVSAAELLLGIL